MQVKVVGKKGVAVTIEWFDEGLHRAIIPEDALVDDETVDPGVLLAAIEVGVPWAAVVEERLCSVLATAIQETLYRYGIWTAEDARAKINQTASALMAAYSLDAQRLIAMAGLWEEAERQMEVLENER